MGTHWLAVAAVACTPRFMLIKYIITTLFVCLHPPYGTQFPTAFVTVNLLTTFRKHLKTLHFQLEFSAKSLATYYPAPQIQLLDFGAL